MVHVGSVQPGLRINSCFLFVIINYQENLRRCYHGWGGVKLPCTNISFRWGKVILLDSSLWVNWGTFQLYEPVPLQVQLTCILPQPYWKKKFQTWMTCTLWTTGHVLFALQLDQRSVPYCYFLLYLFCTDKDLPVVRGYGGWRTAQR